MAEVMDLIKQERDRAGLTVEQFAVTVGLTSATLSRQNRQKNKLSIDSLHAYARYARKVGNITLLRALGAYALNLELDDIIINPSK